MRLSKQVREKGMNMKIFKLKFKYNTPTLWVHEVMCLRATRWTLAREKFYKKIQEHLACLVTRR